MSSSLPHLNYSSKSDLADVLTTNGLPTDNFLALNEDFGVAFFELYIPHILPTLSEDQRTTLADELVGMCRAITPFSYSWNATKAENRAQKQLEMTYWGKMGSLLQQHALVPSEYHYSRFLWNITYKSLVPEYFEWLHTLGAVLRSDSLACNDTWYLVLDQCANKEACAGAQWLIDHNIWPTCQGVKPTYGSVRENDTIFSWVRHNNGVPLLKQLPNDRLKACMNHPNDLGRTPLHHATASLMPDMVALLLELGAEKQPTDNKGKYPLDIIRKTTSRVENISAIQNMLGGTTSKTPKELLADAIKKFDTSILAQALKDPTIFNKKSDIVFDVLAYGVGNSTPSVYKKMRQRKMDMFFALLENTALNYQNAEGDTFLHAAIKSGMLPAVQYLLERSPQLTQVSNGAGEFAADMVIEQFDKLTEYQYGVHASYSEYIAEMQRDTSKKILKIYQKHNIHLQGSNFPALLEDPNWRALLSKMQLERALGESEAVQQNKRKM